MTAMNNAQQLVAACTAMVVLAFVVGARMLVVRIGEIRARRLTLQAASTSLLMATTFHAVQPADNFRNLFEVPVLFYALAAIALATSQVPDWLVIGLWSYVGLRFVHSLIQCTYNKVSHRFAVFAISFFLLVGLWFAFMAGFWAKNAA